MHEVLLNCFFKLAQEKVWLGELTAVDLGREATKQTKDEHKMSRVFYSNPSIFSYNMSCADSEGDRGSGLLPPGKPQKYRVS